ncbi:hypothetical protein CRYUN_Cryun09bG0217100 [Craigia yunnanensis]
MFKDPTMEREGLNWGPFGNLVEMVLGRDITRIFNIHENPSRKSGSYVPKAAAASESNPEAEVKAAEVAAKLKAKTLQLALCSVSGHISACVSFSKVAVSFTHVIKSSEPVFSVPFSSFLGDTYPLKVWLSIVPIVLGCSLAAITVVSFNFEGLWLWGALISNVGFVIISPLYQFPVAVIVEGSQWVQGYHKAIETVGKASTFYIWVLLSGIFYHLYNQSSYQALDEISPLTFSVGNTMKRVVVIVSTVLVFRNPVRPLNALGSGIAILGTFLYSQVTAKF